MKRIMKSKIIYFILLTFRCNFMKESDAGLYLYSGKLNLTLRNMAFPTFNHN